MAYNISEFLKKGKEKEIEFAQCLIKHKGGEITYASKWDDMNNHVDLYWNSWGFDVKGMKKSRRHDDNYDDTLHYVEMQNVKGDIGWLYGKAHYFAFELMNSWLIISQEKLIKFINEYVDFNKIITYTDEFYKCQTRNNRNDIFTKVKTKDLLKIANLVLDK